MPRHSDNTWLERMSGYLKSQFDSQGRPLSITRSSNATVTSVNDTASSTTLLNQTPTRVEAIIQNDSSSTLYVKFSTTATTSDYTVKLAQNDVLTTQFTGRIDGIWSSDSSGSAKITETT